MATLMQAIATFSRLAVEMPMAEHAALEAACQIVEDEAKHAIGTYNYNWPQLAPSTQADRVQQGFPANEPLLRTGEMRDSIEHQVQGHVGYVGSDNMKAVYQELGTVHIPPRSFLMGAAMRSEHEIHELTGRYFHAYLASGLGLPYSHFSGQAVGRVGSAPPLDAAFGRLTGRIRP